MKRDFDPVQQKRAKALRQFSTKAEAILWKSLRDHRMNGIKFRRQQRIGPFIADFASLDARLVIEADGPQHDERIAEDAARTAFLEAEGYRALRFRNAEILTQLENVLRVISLALA